MESAANLSGTAASIQRLYLDHHAWLQGWLRFRLGNDADAADLAQDAFLRLFARDGVLSCAPLREPRKYLATIAKGLMVDHWRRCRLAQAYHDVLAQAPVPTVPSPEQRLLILEVLAQLLTMLEQLPARVRQAFMLAQLDGLSYAEIGRRLKVSERTVCKYVAQAMLQCLLLAEADGASA